MPVLVKHVRPNGIASYVVREGQRPAQRRRRWWWTDCPDEAAAFVDEPTARAWAESNKVDDGCWWVTYVDQAAELLTFKPAPRREISDEDIPW